MMTTKKKVARYLQFIGCAALICGGVTIKAKDSQTLKYVTENVTDYNTAFDKAEKENPKYRACIRMARSAGF